VEEPYPRYYGNPDDIPKPHHTHTQRDAAPRHLWEQLLYEGIMEGLGYAKNEAAFAALARSVPLASLKRQGLQNTSAMMALLFGTAGLLPSTRKVADRESRTYIRPLRSQWRSLRPLVKGPLLHEADWKFFRLRPGNFPTVRLAAWCRLLPRLLGEDAIREIIALFKSESLSPRERQRALAGLLADTPDEFWRHHYRFGPAARRPVPGLGQGRVIDLAVNVILPIVLLYARVFRDPVVRRTARGMLMDIPEAGHNAVTRHLDRQLLRGRVPLRSAFLQQGTLQLYKMYCRLERCHECELGMTLGFSQGH
jgi:hypothetical protein